MDGDASERGQQPQIAYWNVTRLANALAPLFADVEPLREGLKRYIDAFVAADHANTAAKPELAIAEMVAKATNYEGI